MIGSCENFDVAKAVIQACIDFNVYIKFPQGCGDMNGSAVLLQSAVCALCQSGRRWHLWLRERVL